MSADDMLNDDHMTASVDVEAVKQQAITIVKKVGTEVVAKHGVGKVTLCVGAAVTLLGVGCVVAESFNKD